MDKKKSKKILQLGVIALLIVIGMAMFAHLDDFIPTGGDAMNTKTQPYRGAATGIKIVEGHWQGMEAVPLTWELAAKLGIPLDEKGVLIDEVTLAAGESGLRAGDLIQALNGVSVTNLEEFYNTTKRVRNQNRVSITALRGRDSTITVELIVPDVLGFAQMESAPMVLAGSIPPHRYRGPCTDCHEIGTTGELTPDPGNITLMPPPISKKTKSPHRHRGKCILCHVVR